MIGAAATPGKLSMIHQMSELCGRISRLGRETNFGHAVLEASANHA